MENTIKNEWERQMEGPEKGQTGDQKPGQMQRRLDSQMDHQRSKKKKGNTEDTSTVKSAGALTRRKENQQEGKAGITYIAEGPAANTADDGRASEIGNGAADKQNNNQVDKQGNKKKTVNGRYTLRDALRILSDDNIPDASWDIPPETYDVAPDKEGIPFGTLPETLPDSKREVLQDRDADPQQSQQSQESQQGAVTSGDFSAVATGEAAKQGHKFSTEEAVNTSEVNPVLNKMRRRLLILPVLVLPLVSLIFWVFSQRRSSETRKGAIEEGINTTVPRASLKGQPQGKMELYKQAAAQKRYGAGGDDEGIKVDDDVNGLGGINGTDGSTAKDDASSNSFLAGSLGGTAGGNKHHSSEADLSRGIAGELFEDEHTLQAEKKIAELQALINQAAQDKKSPGRMAGAGPYELYNNEKRYYEKKRKGEKEDVFMRRGGAHENGALHEQNLHELRQLKDVVTGAANGDGGEFNGRVDGSGGGTGGDPETREINQMLDKVLAIQKGMASEERISPGNNQAVYQGQPGHQGQSVIAGHQNVYHPVKAKDEAKNNPGDLSVPLLFPGDSVWDRAQPQGIRTYKQEAHASGAFYDIDGGGIPDSAAADQNTAAAAATIPAVVAETQTLVSGATVKLKLQSPVSLGGWSLPVGCFIYGTAAVAGERLQVVISHIRTGDYLLPVHLKVFDRDGIEGIRIPGSINRDAAKESADRGLSSMQLMSLDPGVAAQAAAAGIQAAKGLLSKKVKLVRVTVKAGYPVVLVDEKSGK